MNTGVGCRFLLQGIFPTQGANPGLPHGRQTLDCLSYQECQTRPNAAPPPHTHIQKLYSLSPVYFQNLAQCLAQADAQKLFNKSTSAGLNVNLKRSSASDEIKTVPAVWFCRLLSIREGSIRFNQENKSPPERDHKG